MIILYLKTLFNPVVFFCLHLHLSVEIFFGGGNFVMKWGKMNVKDINIFVSIALLASPFQRFLLLRKNKLE